MGEETTVSRRIKKIEERLTQLEDIEDSPQTTTSMKGQNKRIKSLVHRNHAETLDNSEKIQHLNRIIFHIARKNHAQDATLTKLTRDIKEQNPEDEESYDYSK